MVSMVTKLVLALIPLTLGVGTIAGCGGRPAASSSAAATTSLSDAQSAWEAALVTAEATGAATGRGALVRMSRSTAPKADILSALPRPQVVSGSITGFDMRPVETVEVRGGTMYLNAAEHTALERARALMAESPGTDAASIRESSHQLVQCTRTLEKQWFDSEPPADLSDLPGPPEALMNDWISAQEEEAFQAAFQKSEWAMEQWGPDDGEALAGEEALASVDADELAIAAKRLDHAVEAEVREGNWTLADAEDELSASRERLLAATRELERLVTPGTQRAVSRVQVQLDHLMADADRRALERLLPTIETALKDWDAHTEKVAYEVFPNKIDQRTFYAPEPRVPGAAENKTDKERALEAWENARDAAKARIHHIAPERVTVRIPHPRYADIQRALPVLRAALEERRSQLERLNATLADSDKGKEVSLAARLDQLRAERRHASLAPYRTYRRLRIVAALWPEFPA